MTRTMVALALLLSSSSAFAGKAEILSAIELPEQAEKAREAGIPDEQVSEALDAAKDKGLKAGESAEVMKEAGKDAKEHGNVDNFGSFVKSKLDEGLRGKELAAAIRAEHEANGKGKSGEHGKPDDKGKPDDAGKPDDKGKPDDAGKPDDKGKPDDAGKPDDKGKPADAGGKPEGKGKPETMGRPTGKGGN